uniref:RNase H type-1 domain-containing protein n=2 Tax=Brassica oleracea TaxID=3712 RepID=A0A0D3B6R4_BRAOL
MDQSLIYQGPSWLVYCQRDLFAGIVNMIKQKASGWSNRFLSITGKLVMLKSALSPIPSFAMSCFKLPLSLIKRIQSAVTRFIWDDRSKLSWRIINNPHSLSSQVLCGKYCTEGNLLECQSKSSESHGWKGILIGRDLIVQNSGWTTNRALDGLESFKPILGKLNRMGLQTNFAGMARRVENRQPSQVDSILKTDAAWSVSASRAGLRWIISRNANTTTYSRIENNVSSPLMAESLAMREAIQTCRDLGIMKLRVESDSKIIINSVLNDNSVPELYGVVTDILLISSAFKSVCFKWILRENNYAADLLAKHVFG